MRQHKAMPVIPLFARTCTALSGKGHTHVCVCVCDKQCVSLYVNDKPFVCV